jgi:hypothetical protein
MKHYFLSLGLIILFSCQNMPKQNDVAENATDQLHGKRFFSDESFWNQPIADDAEADPKSDYWISLLERDPSGENIGINVKRYTIPIYEVNSKEMSFQKFKTKPANIKNSDTISFSGHEPEFDSLGVPISENMEPSPGGDMHVAIIDWEENKVWDMFWVKKLGDGSWLSSTGMVYPLDGPGVFEQADFDVKLNESIHGYGPGVAAGMPIIAGVVRYDEVMSGEIRHKLCIALRYVAFQKYVFPATWTDGNFDGGIPEGATLQLDPELDLTQFDLTKEEMVIAKALQKYGCVVNDFAAGSCLRAEYLGAIEGKSWEEKIRGWDEPGGIKTIPVKHYRILKCENIKKGGDKKKKFFLELLYFEGEEPPKL